MVIASLCVYKVQQQLLRLELMHVVGEDYIWRMMEVLCAYGMWSRIWKEFKFGMIGVCKVCFLYEKVS